VSFAEANFRYRNGEQRFKTPNPYEGKQHFHRPITQLVAPEVRDDEGSDMGSGADIRQIIFLYLLTMVLFHCPAATAHCTGTLLKCSRNFPNEMV